MNGQTATKTLRGLPGSRRNVKGHAFGRTGVRLSLLGFGAVGGLMVRGDPADQERTVASAIAAGVNYFETAVLYGNSESRACRNGREHC